MRVLMTTDVVGGVWQYSLALARGLVEAHNCRVALVCLGEPSEEDLRDQGLSDRVDVVPLTLKLEWMPGGADDLQDGLDQVGRLVSAWGADLVHSSQYGFALVDTPVPRVVVAHSDVLSWLAWHRYRLDQSGFDLPRLRNEVQRDAFLRRYGDMVATALSAASAVVAPSSFAARSLTEIYGCETSVIHNGLWPELHAPAEGKNGTALVAGRLWDEAKNAAVAVEATAGLSTQLLLAGPTTGPSGEETRLPSAPNARYLGPCSWSRVRQLMSDASFYLATSSYEPFGLSVLEAALSGCSILANDTPVFRELWGDAVSFYAHNNAADLRAKLRALLDEPEEAARLGEAARERAIKRFDAGRMAAEYSALYGRLTSGRS